MINAQHVSLKDGTNLCLRQLKPGDREMVREFFAALSADSKYSRYFQHKSELSEAELEACTSGPHYVIGVWVCNKKGAEAALIGTASYIKLNDDANRAEFAIIVADAWQNRGIGKHLVRAVLDSAREAGIERLLVYFLPSNNGMKKLAQSMADDVTFRIEEGAVVADVDLSNDEVSAFFWPETLSEIWDSTFQSVLDMSFMPFTIYLDIADEGHDMMKSMINFDHVSEFENWMDTIENPWF